MDLIMWRVFGWIMTVAVVAGAILFLAIVSTVGFTNPGSRIDWAFVPSHAVAPLWLANSMSWMLALVMAAIPAPFGFFRRARGLPAWWLMLTYASATPLTALVIIGSHLYLAYVGVIRINEHTYRSVGYDKALTLAVIFIVACIPVVGALFALRRGKRERRGFEVERLPGATDGTPSV